MTKPTNNGINTNKSTESKYHNRSRYYLVSTLAPCYVVIYTFIQNNEI